MSNYFSIYEIEKLEIEKNIYYEIRNKLEEFLFEKIKINTVAYKNLDLLIYEIKEKESNIKKEIETIKSSIKSEISEIKINTSILEKLFLLRNELQLPNINELLKSLVNDYEIHQVYNKLTLIEKHSISDTISKNLKNTKFNIAKAEDIDKPIVYTIDELIVKNELQFLDLTNFKPYQSNVSGYYLFSFNFTLGDLDEFFKILSK
ncbi:hypothetical protein ACMC56_01240 [Campylobacterota bacterium DY0563]